MAITKTVAVQLGVTDGAFLTPTLAVSASATQAGADVVLQPFSVTTAWTAVTLGQCSPADWIMLVNRDATNYVQIAVDLTGTKIPFARLVPNGAPMVLPADPTVTLYWKANVAACLVTCLVTEP